MDQDFIAIVGLGVTMLALMWNTRSETFRRFTEIKQDTGVRFTEMKRDTDARFTEMKQNMDVRFDAMERKFDVMERKFDAMERKTDATANVMYGLAERTARIEGVLLGPGRPAGNGESGARWTWTPAEADRPEEA